MTKIFCDMCKKEIVDDNLYTMKLFFKIEAVFELCPECGKKILELVTHNG